MKIGIILTTYNSPNALDVVLKAYNRQKDMSFELVVADDGSGFATKNVISEFQKISKFKIKHVWQEDKGFRASAIRNLAVAELECDYLIFTDGDCIPSDNFVFQHRKFAERGYFLSGNRILLSKFITKKILKKKFHIEKLKNWDLFKLSLKGDINRMIPLLYFPDTILRKINKKKWKGAKTCNLSVWSDDFKKIEGFDETFQGWGMEDTDLVVRLINSGIMNKNFRFTSNLFHLWHEENDRTNLQSHIKRINYLINTNRTLPSKEKKSG